MIYDVLIKGFGKRVWSCYGYVCVFVVLKVWCRLKNIRFVFGKVFIFFCVKGC